MTPLHGIPKYNMSVVANSEKQALVSFRKYTIWWKATIYMLLANDLTTLLLKQSCG